MATSCYFWGTSKSGFAKREGKDSLLMPAPILAMFSLFFLPFSFFFSLCSFNSQFLTALLPWVVPPLVFPFLGSLSLGAYYFLTICFSLFSSMATFSFYSKLIQWDFSILFPRLHQLFLACCGHSFRTAHQPIGCLATTTTQYRFATFCLFLLYTSTSRFGLPHHLPLWHASGGLNHLVTLLDKIPSQQHIFPKEVTAGNQIQTPFSPPPNHTL